MHCSILLSTTLLALATFTAANPAPSPDIISCWETCSTDCESAGLIRGGLCDSAGTCTCLSGNKERDTTTSLFSSRDVISCWETCSTDCESAGNPRGGLCDASGDCTCLTGQKKRLVAEKEKRDEISCWETCSTDCESAGNLQGGTCDSTGTCTCL